MKHIISTWSLRAIMQFVDLRKLYDEQPAAAADFLLLNKELETKKLDDQIVIVDIP